MMILGRTNGFKPASIKGRGILKDENVYEFQAAAPDENPIELCKKIKDEWKGRSVDSIRTLPDRIEYEDMEEFINKERPLAFPVGLNMTTINPEYYDVTKTVLSVVLGETAYIDDFVAGMERITEALGTNLTIIDSSNAGGIIDELFNFCREYKQHKDAGDPLENIETKVFIVRDLKSIQDSVSATQWESIEAIFEKSNIEWGFRFLLCSSPDQLSKYQYSEWFSSVSRNYGIYLGEGFANQYILQTEKFVNETIEYPIGYMVKNKKAFKIKFMQSIDGEVI